MADEKQVPRDVIVPNDVTHPDMTSLPVAESAGPSVSLTEHLLSSIVDLLETRVQGDAAVRHQKEKNQRMMSDWMIAAAVVDRICFLIFGITLVFVNLLFVLLLFLRT